MKIQFLIFTIVLAAFTSCADTKQYVLEVTKFTTKTTASAATFQELDAEVETNFTSKQPGFLKRQSGVNAEGEYCVLVYWETMADADVSMQKFMKDESVSAYASMIEDSSMQMARYTINEGFDADASSFVEVMSYQTSEGTDAKSLAEINNKVQAAVTAPKEGFLQRITGAAEDGTQLVVVYWDNKSNSDAALQPFMEHPVSQEFMGLMDQSTISMGRYASLTSLETKMSNKDKVVALLNSFNTGDQTPISYINPKKYIQHNLAVGDGLAGFGEVMKNAPPQGFSANVVRAFEDGDFVFTHTEYDFFGPKAAFDVFRFEDGLIVEHWDNLLEVQEPNPSGRTQFDGETVLTDLDKTEANKQTIQDFVDKVLLNGEMDKVATYINPQKYIQHNPAVADGLEGFGEAMKYFAENGLVMEYTKLHKVLGQGNYVLTLSEGKFGKGELTAFYDLFRLEDGQIVEHWDVISPIPPKSEWRNSNGKF